MLHTLLTTSAPPVPSASMLTVLFSPEAPTPDLQLSTFPPPPLLIPQSPTQPTSIPSLPFLPGVHLLLSSLLMPQPSLPRRPPDVEGATEREPPTPATRISQNHHQHSSRPPLLSSVSPLQLLSSLPPSSPCSLSFPLQLPSFSSPLSSLLPRPILLHTLGAKGFTM